MSSQHGKRSKSQRKRRGRSSNNARRFVDRARLRVEGGTGGKGSLSMNQLRQKHKFKPDGGNGGAGGSVVIVADQNEQTLLRQHHVRAEKGANGMSNNQTGRNGSNRIVRVPCGVLVKRILEYEEDEDVCIVQDLEGEADPADGSAMMGAANDDAPDAESCDADPAMNTPIYSERPTTVLADLDEPGSYVVVARGGQGGFGTSVHASDHGPLPEASTLVESAKPQTGEVQHLELELKLIADVGLVGFPNAGKSSLLCAMSRAQPKVAPYPFTTVNPIVGCLDYRDGYRVQVADIPGLIDGASQGRGQGHDFLRHVERTKALLYVLDGAGVDGRHPVDDLLVLATELESYGYGESSLLERPALIAANKSDLMADDDTMHLLQQLRETAGQIGIRCESVVPISAGVTGDGLSELSRAIRDVVTNVGGAPQDGRVQEEAF